jgi:integrase
MAKKSLRLTVGSIFTKGPGKIYFFRYQVEGRRKTVSLQTTNRAEALKKAQTFQPVVQTSSVEVIAAHVSHARGLREAERNLCLSDVWEHYSKHPDRSTPATVNVWKQYQANLQEFVEFIGNPLTAVREITPQTADRYAQYLKTTEISVDTHNRKVKQLRKIFSTLQEYRGGENPFSSPVLYRREREEQGLGVRRLAFSREQEQRLLEVLADEEHQVINKSEIRVIYHLGMYTGQRLKDCVLLQWQSIDLERRRIWVKQFKTGKEVTIPISDRLFTVLMEAKSWQSGEYVCPKCAERYNRLDKDGKNTGNNLVNLDVLRVIRWIGVEPSVTAPGRKRKVTQYGFHSLRHTFASHCAEAGVPKAVLLSILGTDSEIADKYYTHIGEEAQLKAIEAISGDSITTAQERIRQPIFILKTELLFDIQSKAANHMNRLGNCLLVP